MKGCDGISGTSLGLWACTGPLPVVRATRRPHRRRCCRAPARGRKCAYLRRVNPGSDCRRACMPYSGAAWRYIAPRSRSGITPAAARARFQPPVFRASSPNSDSLGNDAPSVPARMAVRAHGRSSFGPAWSVLRRGGRTHCRGRGSTGWSRFYGDVGDGSAVPVLGSLITSGCSSQASTAKPRRVPGALRASSRHGPCPVG